MNELIAATPTRDSAEELSEWIGQHPSSQQVLLRNRQNFTQRRYLPGGRREERASSSSSRQSSRSEDNGLISERRMQQLLHYTHKHVHDVRVDTESKLQQLFIAKVHAQDQAQAQVHAQVHAVQQKQIQGAIRASHETLEAMHNSHAAALNSELQLVAHSSELRSIEAAQRTIAECEAVHEDKHQQEMTHLQQSVGACVNDHTETRFAAIRDDLESILESSQKQQEELIEKRFQEKFRTARDQEIQATRAMLEDETKRIASGIELRLGERLQHAEQQLNQEKQAIWSQLEKIKREAAIVTQSVVTQMLEQQTEQLHKHIQQAVLTQCVKYVTSIEARLQKQLCSSRAKLDATATEDAHKFMEKTTHTQIDAVVEEVVAKEITANHETFISAGNSDDLRAEKKLRELAAKPKLACPAASRPTSTEKAICAAKSAAATNRRKAFAAARKAEQSEAGISTCRCNPKLEKARQEVSHRLEQHIQGRMRMLLQTRGGNAD